MDYPFEQLDPDRFQQLCQSLLVKEHKNVQCFPVGQADGGRDAVAYMSSEDERDFLLFQVKFSRKSLNVREARSWVADALDKELPKIEKLIAAGAKRFVLITNVPGSSTADTGSMDRVTSILARLSIPAICWWRDDLNRRMDNAWDLKWVYPELMTGTDLLRVIVEAGLTEDRERRTAAIRAFVRDQFTKDAEVRFKQVDLQNNLVDLFIDVPIDIPRDYASRKQAWQLRHVLPIIARDVRRRGVQAEDSSTEVVVTDDGRTYYARRDEMEGIGAASAALHAAGQQVLDRVVIEGAPGQGKSTITQYVCQVHRMHLLELGTDLAQLPEHHRACPVRIPFRVDLRDFGMWLTRKDPWGVGADAGAPEHWQKSLESFLAAQVRHHSGGHQFGVQDLAAVGRVSALLLAFDGLDEIAEVSLRRDVVDEIRAGVERMSVNVPSLQVFVTSRPAAFANSPGLPPAEFTYLSLASVTRPLIDEYTEKWLRARRLGGQAAKDVRRILKEKLDAPHIRDLARNPMQLAILLNLIHKRGVSLPDARTALYDSYVELFFDREAEKSAIVQEHRSLLINIHRYLAWVLHAQAEEGRTRGSIRTDELERLLGRYLEREELEAQLLQDLFTGMVERVVALVSRVQGTFEFEVQPLREYFAARYLYETAPYSPPGAEKKGTKPDRFDALARDFYWLNVTRFYAGCYSIGELASLIQGLQDLMQDEDYRYLSHPRTLAAMLLADWVFTQQRRSVKAVVGLLLDGIGVRSVLASNSRRHTSTLPLVLPKTCGREELVAHAFDILTSNPARDYAFDLIDLIRQNTRPNETQDRWLSETSKRDGGERTRWLDYGLPLGQLAKLDEAQLDSLLADMPLDSARADILLRAHRADWLQGSESATDATVRAILDRDIRGAAPVRTRFVLEAFAAALEPGYYASAFSNPGMVVDLESVAERRWMRGGIVVEGDLMESAAPTLHACLEVIRAREQAVKLPASEWATKIGPWSDVAEAVRSHLGDGWALCHFANVAAGIRSSTETCVDASELFEADVPLCRRVRYARLRSGTAPWWQRQFEAASDRSQRMLAALVLASWGSNAVIGQLMPVLEEVVTELPEDCWHRVHASLNDAQNLFRMPGIERTAGLNADTLPVPLSPRLAVAIAVRCTEPSQWTIFTRYLAQYNGDDPIILRFCQDVAMERLVDGSSDWKQPLSMIERSYRLGAMSPRYSYHRFIRRFHRSEAMRLPEDAALAIMANPDRFPAHLIALAEGQRRAAVGTKIVPVGRIAERDGWFAESR